MSGTAAAEKTIVNQEIGLPAIGYMLNTLPDETNRKKVAELQAMFTAKFGDVIWNTPPETLHITLMDWLAPLVEYPEDKDLLFERLFASYDAAFTEVLKVHRPIRVRFDMLKVTPNAIILIGHDMGEFQSIREGFLRKIELLPKTKQPPAIIHTTIARFRKEQDLQPIIEFVNGLGVSFEHVVTHFRLVREVIVPQLEYEFIKEYPLA